MIAYSILSQCDELLTDENGRTAFHIAANGGNVSVMKKLFEIQPLIKTNLTDCLVRPSLLSLHAKR